jgi:hypothetical protein
VSENGDEDFWRGEPELVATRWWPRLVPILIATALWAIAGVITVLVLSG